MNISFGSTSVPKANGVLTCGSRLAESAVLSNEKEKAKDAKEKASQKAKDDSLSFPNFPTTSTISSSLAAKERGKEKESVPVEKERVDDATPLDETVRL